MPPDAELETSQLAQIESDLAVLSAHVQSWIDDRFLSAESAAGLNLEDVTGLIGWLRQWHENFDTYAETAAALDGAGLPATKARLAQIRTEIDTSIATFTQMADGLTKEQNLSEEPEAPAG